MKVREIFEMDFINDFTEIFIRDIDFYVLAHGNWYQDDILKYTENDVDSFTWQNDNKIYIDVKEGESL